jgi:hypothetical protein
VLSHLDIASGEILATPPDQYLRMQVGCEDEFGESTYIACGYKTRPLRMKLRKLTYCVVCLIGKMERGAKGPNDKGKDSEISLESRGCRDSKTEGGA